MHFNSLLALCASTASLAAALPTAPDAPLSKRACTVLYPDVTVTFSAASPTTNLFGVALARSGGPGTNTKKAAVAFNYVPPGATGCALHYALPAVAAPDQFAQGASTVDVFGVDRPPSRTTTWNTQPRTTTQWASLNVPEYVTGPYETVLLATTCDEARGFLFQLSDWQQQAGNVTIPQDPTTSGFWLTYNC